MTLVEESCEKKLSWKAEKECKQIRKEGRKAKEEMDRKEELCKRLPRDDPVSSGPGPPRAKSVG